jgi:hypothetical protein
MGVRAESRTTFGADGSIEHAKAETGAAEKRVAARFRKREVVHFE